MSPKTSTPLPPIPPAFAAKKAAILASLAVPASQYNDRSPKGSVDEGIIPLIKRINTLDGVVTTSSCAGRVSVFLEGRKNNSKLIDGESMDSDGEQDSRNVQVVVTGGKGNGGRWLFVSHEPVNVRRAIKVEGSVMHMLGITDDQQQNENGVERCPTRPGMRLVRFQFEPMILHIMTASLAHASSILTAAINAGFRESGVQSLRNIDDPMNAFPMVAVRTSGLALESVIGYVEQDGISVDKAKENIRCMVSQDYLVLLLEVANERFQANEQRKKRFEDDLFESQESKSTERETRQSRQARKRADGLARQRALKSTAEMHAEISNDEGDGGDFDLLMD